MMKKNVMNGTIGVLAICVMFTAGCVSDVKKDGGEGQANVDSTDASERIMTIGGSLFSIPSPIQTAMLIEKSGADYNKGFLNDAKKVNTYATNFQKALNLGVYGADVGYVTMYDQSQDALKYMGVINKLSDELGITGAFDENLVKRFEANFGKRDSMLSMVSVAYRSSDAFLKENDRLNIGALVLAGGWIETVYFSTQLAQKHGNKDIINRIGEQKYTLNNLVKMLTPYYDQPEYDALVDELIELAYDFDAIDIKYTYGAPTVDVASKTTTINSKTEVVITKEHLKAIAERVANLRNKITG
ncbi:MAG: DsbA family protein [Flavobacteriales bacterium]|nr:DsbA family protein [Flavobacteriales bacterium]